jgi:Domain of unknown function (DUF4913)
MITEPDPAADNPTPPSTKLDPQYPNVEVWVRDYLLPSFPRPSGELGAAGRWRWCEQWWRHDEAVTILTALWYGWEHAAVQTLGMLDWLPRLYHLYPVLAGDDGPFRLCSPAAGDLVARHDMPTPAEVVPAPPGWWAWWGTEATSAAQPMDAH